MRCLVILILTLIFFDSRSDALSQRICPTRVAPVPATATMGSASVSMAHDGSTNITGWVCQSSPTRTTMIVSLLDTASSNVIATSTVSTIAGTACTQTPFSLSVANSALKQYWGNPVSIVAANTSGYTIALSGNSDLFRLGIRDITFGGMAGFDLLINPNFSTDLRSSGRAGLYLHGAVMTDLTNNDETSVLDSLVSLFNPYGGQNAELSLLDVYNTGLSINTVNLEALVASDFALWIANTVLQRYLTPGLIPETGTYDCSTRDMAENPSDFTYLWEALNDSPSTPLLETMATICTPNEYQDSLLPPFSDPTWQFLRDGALYSNAVAFDAPPTAYLSGFGPNYRQWVVDHIVWAKANGVRTYVIISPNGAQGDFLSATQQFIAHLEANNARPSNWQVVDYSQNTAEPIPAGYLNYCGDENVSQSITNIALWVSQNAPTVEPTLGSFAKGNIRVHRRIHFMVSNTSWMSSNGARVATVTTRPNYYETFKLHDHTHYDLLDGDRVYIETCNNTWVGADGSLSSSSPTNFTIVKASGGGPRIRTGDQVWLMATTTQKYCTLSPLSCLSSVAPTTPLTISWQVAPAPPAASISSPIFLSNTLYSFESPTYAGGGFAYTPALTTAQTLTIASGGISASGGPWDPINPLPIPDGNQFVFLQNDQASVSGYWSDAATTQMYSASFYYSTRGSTAQDPLSYATESQCTLSVAGQAVWVSPANITVPSGWVPVTTNSFIPSTKNPLVMFQCRDMSTIGKSILLDAFQLSNVTTSSPIFLTGTLYSFESPIYLSGGGFAYSPEVTTSQTLMFYDGGISATGGPWDPVNPLPLPNGNQFAFLQNDQASVSGYWSDASVSQTYSVSFSYSTRGVASGDPTSYATQSQCTIAVGGHVVWTSPVNITVPSGWVAVTTGSFSPPTTNPLVIFQCRDMSTIGKTIVLDDLLISSSSSSPGSAFTGVGLSSNTLYSFESPSFTVVGQFAYTPVKTSTQPWNFTAGGGVSALGSPWDPLNASPLPNGNQYAYLQNDGASIFSTWGNAVVGNSYSATFSYSTRGNASGDPSSYATLSQCALYVGAQSVWVSPANITVSSGWVGVQTSSFVVNSVTPTVVFQCRDHSSIGKTIVLDALTLVGG